MDKSSDKIRVNSLDVETIERVQDADPFFHLDFFYGVFFTFLVAGIICYIVLPFFNVAALIISIVLGLLTGTVVYKYTKKRKGDSKYYLPLEDTNDIPNWNIRDANERKENMEKVKALVNETVSKFKDQNSELLIKTWKKDIYNQYRVFDKSDLQMYEECWVIFEDRFNKKCIVFCDKAFPEKGNWGILLKKDNTLGKITDWYTDLENALTDIEK